VKIRSDGFGTYVTNRLGAHTCPSPSPKRLRAILSSHPMPPKKEPVLSEPEQMLLIIASRINTAIKYKEANPGQDESNYLKNLSEEVVRQFIFITIFGSKFQQKFIHSIYSNFPQSKSHHCVHASIAIVGHEWQLAKHENRSPDIRKITVKAISKGCHNTAQSYPLWPSILWSDNLSKFAAEQPPENQWWLPAIASDDSDDGALTPFYYLIIFLTSLLCHLGAPRRSGRINKGKAPVLPTSDDVGDAPTRGQKRIAAADRPEIIDDDPSEPTPRKGKSAPTFHVVIQSPPSTRPKRRMRKNEAGDAVDVPDVSESASEQLWVGVGAVCNHNYLHLLTRANLSTRTDVKNVLNRR
jgi:hypothetical protein